MKPYKAFILGLIGAVWGTPVHAFCIEKSVSETPYIVCRFDPQRVNIRTHLLDAQGKPYGNLGRYIDASKRNGSAPIFAMNGGMYDEANWPVGLYIEQQRTLKPANRAGGYGNFHLKPNGVFAISGGKAVVQSTQDYLSSRLKADFATQSGPMLVIKNQLHPRFSAASASRKIRNGVGIATNGDVIFAVSRRAVTFADFALLFRDHLNCANALYLDGTISSIYAPEIGISEIFWPFGPIIAIASR